MGVSSPRFPKKKGQGLPGKGASQEGGHRSLIMPSYSDTGWEELGVISGWGFLLMCARENHPLMSMGGWFRKALRHCFRRIKKGGFSSKGFPG